MTLQQWQIWLISLLSLFAYLTLFFQLYILLMHSGLETIRQWLTKSITILAVHLAATVKLFYKSRRNARGKAQQ